MSRIVRCYPFHLGGLREVLPSRLQANVLAPVLVRCPLCSPHREKARPKAKPKVNLVPRQPDFAPSPQAIWESIKDYPWAERHLVPGLDPDPQDQDQDQEYDDAGPAHHRLREEDDRRELQEAYLGECEREGVESDDVPNFINEDTAVNFQTRI